MLKVEHITLGVALHNAPTNVAQYAVTAWAGSWVALWYRADKLQGVCTWPSDGDDASAQFELAVAVQSVLDRRF